jgi:hypothetical protein
VYSHPGCQRAGACKRDDGRGAVTGNSERFGDALAVGVGDGDNKGQVAVHAVGEIDKMLKVVADEARGFAVDGDGEITFTRYGATYI